MKILDSLLYPPIEPRVQHSLQVDHQHQLYVEESGQPNGLPILFIHGGPGGGCDPIHRRFFDPSVYRIILFDQRGCGKSTPHACLTNNTTAHLIEDIEKIRQHLNIDQWILFGGSWGSTLALLYAQAYPERVLSLILRGIFLCRQQDIDWFYQQGANRFFAEAWQNFIAPIAPEKRPQMVNAYYELLTSENEIERMKAAEAWSVWEGQTSKLVPDHHLINHFANPHHALAMARIECHYFIHHAFIEPNQILDNCTAIQHLPTYIVQGHYDMVCPINQADALAQQLPQAHYILCHSSGHSAMEVEIATQLIKATDQVALDWHNE